MTQKGTRNEDRRRFGSLEVTGGHDRGNQCSRKEKNVMSLCRPSRIRFTDGCMIMSEPIKCPLCGVIFDPEEDGCIEVSNGSQVETACLECGYKIMNELLDCLGKDED